MPLVSKYMLLLFFLDFGIIFYFIENIFCNFIIEFFSFFHPLICRFGLFLVSYITPMFHPFFNLSLMLTEWSSSYTCVKALKFCPPCHVFILLVKRSTQLFDLLSFSFLPLFQFGFSSVFLSLLNSSFLFWTDFTVSDGLPSSWPLCMGGTLILLCQACAVARLSSTLSTPTLEKDCLEVFLKGLGEKVFLWDPGWPQVPSPSASVSQAPIWHHTQLELFCLILPLQTLIVSVALYMFRH